jgi:hypothetical protein
MKLFFLSLAAVCLASCGYKAQSSKHLQVVQVGLITKHEEGTKPLIYSAFFKLKEGSPAPVYLKARFGSPRGVLRVKVATERIAEAGMTVMVSTEPFVLTPKQPWDFVTAELYSDAAMRNKIDEVTQKFPVRELSPEAMRKQGVGHLVD